MSAETTRTIEVTYNGRVARAYSREDGIKQLGETPAEAVEELWDLIEAVEGEEQ
jgi:hypothetical protein